MSRLPDPFRNRFYIGLCVFSVASVLAVAVFSNDSSRRPASSSMIVRMAPRDALARSAYVACLLSALPDGRNARVRVADVVKCHRRAAVASDRDQRDLIVGLLLGNTRRSRRPVR